MRSTAFEGRDFKRTRRRFLATTFDRLGNGEIKSRLGGLQRLRVLLSVAAASSSFFFFRKRDREITPFFRDNGTRDRGPVPRTYVASIKLNEHLAVNRDSIH